MLTHALIGDDGKTIELGWPAKFDGLAIVADQRVGEHGDPILLLPLAAQSRRVSIAC